MILKYSHRVKESVSINGRSTVLPDWMVNMMAKRLEKVDRLLGLLEDNLDEKHCTEVLQRHMDAIGGKSGREAPLSVYCKKDHEQYPIKEDYDDTENML